MGWRRTVGPPTGCGWGRREATLRVPLLWAGRVGGAPPTPVPVPPLRSHGAVGTEGPVTYELIRGDATTLPLADDSVDLILAQCTLRRYEAMSSQRMRREALCPRLVLSPLHAMVSHRKDRVEHPSDLAREVLVESGQVRRLLDLDGGPVLYGLRTDQGGRQNLPSTSRCVGDGARCSARRMGPAPHMRQQEMCSHITSGICRPTDPCGHPQADRNGGWAS